MFILQVIELNFDQLPDGNETLGVLRQENARLSYWVTLAVSIVVHPFFVHVMAEWGNAYCMLLS